MRKTPPNKMLKTPPVAGEGTEELLSKLRERQEAEQQCCMEEILAVTQKHKMQLAGQVQFVTNKDGFIQAVAHVVLMPVV